MIELLAVILLVLLIFVLQKLSSLKDDIGGLNTGLKHLSDVIWALSRDIHKLTDKKVEKDDSARLAAAEPINEKTLEKVEVKAVQPAVVKDMKLSMPPPIPVVPVVSVRDRDDEAGVQEEEARPVPKIVETSRQILGKIWNWILVGDEHRPEGVTTEYAVASTWLLRLGIVAIVTCVGYFLKWSIEQELIGPEARVALSMMVGVGLLVWGMRLVGKKYHLIGQGFLGGGLLILYFSVYAAALLYNLISMPPAYFLMILVTVTAGILAVRNDSMLVAIFGIAGGYVTPLLLSKGGLYLPALYSYILLLGMGILGVAHYKQWRLLNYLGFVCTYVLFLLSLHDYESKTDFNATISFLSAFFILHSTIVYMYNIARAKKTTILEIIHLVANAVIYSFIGYWLIREAHGRPYPALMSMGLAIFYILHVYVFLKRGLADRILLVALIALSGAAMTWTLPLVLEKESLTIAFSLMGLMFLWLGRRLSSNFIQNIGHLLYVVVFIRMALFDLPDNFDFKPSREMTMSVYWQHMAGRLWTFGISIGSIIAAFFLQRRGGSDDQGIVKQENDIPEVVSRSAAGNFFFWGAVGLIFVFMHLELNTMFQYYLPLRMPMLTMLWCGMVVFFLCRYLTSENTGRPEGVMFAAMCFFLMGAFLKLWSFDLLSWRFTERLVYGCEYNFLYAGMRFLDFGMIIGLMLAIWAIFTRRGGEKRTRSVFGYGGLVLLFIYASLELNSFLYWKMPKFKLGGMSVLWALFAIGFTSAGIWKRVLPLRFMGLCLFVVVTGKVFFVDLASMEVIYRVIAFMVVGITLLLGSFAYIHSDRKFELNTSSKGEE